MNNISAHVSSTIKRFRKEKNITTEKLADLLTVSVGTVNNIENKRYNTFKLDLLFEIMRILDIPLSQLLKVDDNSLSLTVNSNDYKLSLDLPFADKEIINLYIDKLSELNKNLVQTISSYENKKRYLEIIFNMLNTNLDTIKNTSKLK